VRERRRVSGGQIWVRGGLLLLTVKTG
jgi:hypothetical protein